MKKNAQDPSGSLSNAGCCWHAPRRSSPTSCRVFRALFGHLFLCPRLHSALGPSPRTSLPGADPSPSRRRCPSSAPRRPVLCVQRVTASPLRDLHRVCAAGCSSAGSEWGHVPQHPPGAPSCPVFHVSAGVEEAGVLVKTKGQLGRDHVLCSRGPGRDCSLGVFDQAQVYLP